LLGMTRGRVALPLIVVTWDGQSDSTDVHSPLNLPPASQPLGMTKGRVGFPFEIGCTDPRSQRRDLGHPSICSFDFVAGRVSRVIPLPTRHCESAPPNDKGEGGFLPLRQLLGWTEPQVPVRLRSGQALHYDNADAPETRRSIAEQRSEETRWAV
jgi:hypothetical protein